MSESERVQQGSNDIPISKDHEDSLGLTDYVDALADFILDCETPMTVAIQGDWGSGKTSLMNLIRGRLEGQSGKSVRCLWINTWQYSQFDLGGELCFSVLSLFSRQLADQPSSAAKVLKSIRDLALRAGKGAATAAATFYAGKESTDAISEAFAADPVNAAERISELRQELQALTFRVMEEKKYDRFVVFIDDIDRLVPGRAVELLEVLKVFLDLKGCVFVLACDYQVVSRGLRDKFGADSSDLRGKHFFDKIIQLPFTMPLGQMAVSNYLHDRLLQCGIELDTEESSGQIHLYERLMVHSTGFNPRGLKRLTNCLRILRLVATRKGVLDSIDGQGSTAERQRALFAALCLQTAFEPLYEVMVDLAARATDKLGECIEWIKALGTGSEATSAFSMQERLNLAIARCEKERAGSREAIPRFFIALEKALQIQTGTDGLDPEEIAMFASLLRFSTMTSVGVASIGDGGEVDLSRVRPVAQTCSQRLREALGCPVVDGDEYAGAWVSPSIPRLGFALWFGFDLDGSLCISFDLTTESRNRRPVVRQWLRSQGRALLEKHLASHSRATEIQMAGSNAVYGLLFVRLQPPGFALRRSEEIEASTSSATSDVLIPLCKDLQSQKIHSQ